MQEAKKQKFTSLLHEIGKFRVETTTKFFYDRARYTDQTEKVVEKWQDTEKY
jgi:hypothetical protein